MILLLGWRYDISLSAMSKSENVDMFNDVAHSYSTYAVATFAKVRIIIHFLWF